MEEDIVLFTETPAPTTPLAHRSSGPRVVSSVCCTNSNFQLRQPGA